jgi:hypothetical protein
MVDFTDAWGAFDTWCEKEENSDFPEKHFTIAQEMTANVFLC